MARVNIEWHGDRIEALSDAAVAKGINDGLDMIAETSQDWVPVQTGELKRSKGTSQDGHSGSVYYTDSKAAAAHENLTAKLRNGKSAKFLEIAMYDRAEDAFQAVADQLRDVL